MIELIHKVNVFFRPNQGSYLLIVIYCHNFAQKYQNRGQNRLQSQMSRYLFVLDHCECVFASLHLPPRFTDILPVKKKPKEVHDLVTNSFSISPFCAQLTR